MATKKVSTTGEAAPAAPVAKVQVKKREFADRVALAAGAKPADAKPVIEATLAQIAAALSSGAELVIPPLGRVKVTKEKEAKSGRILLLRLQTIAGDDQPKKVRTPKRPAKAPLAEAGD